jgi:hypothetical protein
VHDSRTLTRALGRLDLAGLLAERSKGSVVLSARRWLLLEPPSQPGTRLGREERHRGATPVVFRAESHSGELACAAMATETDPHYEDEGELDAECGEMAEDELAESRDEGAWSAFSTTKSSP